MHLLDIYLTNFKRREFTLTLFLNVPHFFRIRMTCTRISPLAKLLCNINCRQRFVAACATHRFVSQGVTRSDTSGNVVVSRYMYAPLHVFGLTMDLFGHATVTAKSTQQIKLVIHVHIVQNLFSYYVSSLFITAEYFLQ